MDSVIVVEDDPAMRESVVDVLTGGGYRVTAYSSSSELLARITEPSACLVLDVCLPSESGIDLYHRLIMRGILTPVVFMTGYEDVPTSVMAMKAGAIDFLLKPVSASALLGAVQVAVSRNGYGCWPPDIGDRVSRLTPREREVFDLVATGLLNKQIAGRLEISMGTVKAHRGRLTRKLGVSTIADLVRLADRIGSLASST